MDEYQLGTHHHLDFHVGETLIAPLVTSFTLHMPEGSVLALVAPIGPELKEFLKQHRTGQRDRWWSARVHRLDLRAHGLQLAATLQEANARRLAVWISVVKQTGELLAELEDSNNYLWLRDELDHQAQAAILSDVRKMHRVQVQ